MNAVTAAAGAHVVVVGAGQAGVQVGESLRSLGFQGSISLVGAEPYGPYHRPPLSKEWLTGRPDPAQLVLRAPDALDRKGIRLRTDTQAVALRLSERRVEFADGSTLPFTGLALTTGARPRRLPVPGADARGVVVLRSRDDAAALASGLDRCRRDGLPLVVIGGGFVGLEVASAARGHGVQVTVLEAQQRLLARALAEPLSAWYEQLHRGHGVEVVLGAAVSEILTRAGAAVGVRLQDGRTFPAGLVLLGVGADPDDALARAAGLACDRGIVVDGCGRTSDPAVVAAGDCTVTRMPDGSQRRLESVQNAVEQGKAAAAALLGLDRPFSTVPWFWSQQYDVKLQLAGTGEGVRDWRDADGRPATAPPPSGPGAFSVYGYRDGRLVGVQSVNAPRDHLQARRLLAQVDGPAEAGPVRDGG